MRRAVSIHHRSVHDRTEHNPRHKPGTRRRLSCLRVLTVSAMSLLLLGCATTRYAPTQSIVPTAGPPPYSVGAGEERLPLLVAAERAAARAGDLALLAALWAPDGRIIDGRGTPEREDDYVWPSREAILDRYRIAVFPSPPPPFDIPPEFVAQIDDDRASAQLNGDHWSFVYRSGRWWLAELAYALE